MKLSSIFAVEEVVQIDDEVNLNEDDRRLGKSREKI